ncbi:MAG: alpha-E domain-containing protein, partial [Betaproteobacteria bacterium]
GSSKDTWIVSKGAVNTFSLLKPSLGKADLIRSGSNLSSRVVENLYWFGRYTERCDSSARFLRLSLARLIGASTDTLPALASAIDLCGVLKLLPELDPDSEPKNPMVHAEFEQRMLTAICGEEWGDGLAGNIRRLLWVGTQVRERFSLDNWHALNRLQRQLQRYDDDDHPEVSDAQAFLDQILLASSALAGFAMDDITRDDGWRFLIIGRRIERVIFLANAISGFLRLNSTRAAGSLEWLLELADSSITYRSRYMAQPELLPALDLIVFDDANPHAVIFQLTTLERYLSRLPRELGETRDDAWQQATAHLQAFDLACLEHLDFSSGEEGEPYLDLAGRLDAISFAASTLSDRLALRYFTHVGDVGRQTLAA